MNPRDDQQLAAQTQIQNNQNIENGIVDFSSNPNI